MNTPFLWLSIRDLFVVPPERSVKPLYHAYDSLPTVDVGGQDVTVRQRDAAEARQEWGISKVQR
jgi:hypothetical protein